MKGEEEGISRRKRKKNIVWGNSTEYIMKVYINKGKRRKGISQRERKKKSILSRKRKEYILKGKEEGYITKAEEDDCFTKEEEEKYKERKECYS